MCRSQEMDLGNTIQALIWMVLWEWLLNVVCHSFILQRSTGGAAGEDKPIVDTTDSFTNNSYFKEKELGRSSTNLVFGYLNLFSDGVVRVCLIIIFYFFMNLFLIIWKKTMDSNHTVSHIIAAAQFYWWDGSGKCFPSLWICWRVV